MKKKREAANQTYKPHFNKGEWKNYKRKYDQRCKKNNLQRVWMD